MRRIGFLFFHLELLIEVAGIFRFAANDGASAK